MSPFVLCAAHSLFAYILFLAWTFCTMSGAELSPWLSWVLERFDNPIWQHDLAPWRRRQASAPGWPRGHSNMADGVLDMASLIRGRRPQSQSEPTRDRPEWVPSRRASPWRSDTIVCGSPEPNVTNLATIMSRVADPYWANRGWVLHLFISFKLANTNWFYRRRSDSLRRRSSKQIPQDSPLHSARRSSSSN